jgi:hypothetical protein
VVASDNGRKKNLMGMVTDHNIVPQAWPLPPPCTI